MARIFISYRRDDSMADAFLIFDRLKAAFGEEVFWDIQSLGAGVKFVSEIIDVVNHIDAMVVVIGRQWLTLTDSRGKRRLDDPDDILRTEIATALSRDILVIPVLIGGATIPTKTDLPDNLKALTERNALSINYRSFEHDIALLTNSIVRKLDISNAPRLNKQSFQKTFISTEADFAEFFGFVTEELELNRKGQLSNAQTVYLTTRRRFILIRALKLLLISGIVIVPFLLNQSVNLISLISLIFGGFGLLGGTIVFIESAFAHIRKPSLSTTVGILGYYSDGKSMYIGKKQFFTRKPLFRSPNSPAAGLVYFVYHVGSLIMSAELSNSLRGD